MSEDQKSDESADTGAGTELARQELPSWNRSRSKKRKQQGDDDDAFQRGVQSAGRAALSRGWVVIGAIGLAVGAIGLGVYLYGADKEGAAQGTRVLASAVGYENRAMIGDIETFMGTLEREPPTPIVKDEAERDANVESALADLEAVGHEDSILAAKVPQGVRALRAGDHAAALAHYDDFLKSAPADHAMAFLAREGRAMALEASGDLDAALGAFEGMAPDEGQFYRDMALYHQARILERLERKDDAIARYKQYIQEFPLNEGSLARENVKNRMLELDPDGLAAMGPVESPDSGVQIQEGP